MEPPVSAPSPTNFPNPNPITRYSQATQFFQDFLYKIYPTIQTRVALENIPAKLQDFYKNSQTILDEIDQLNMFQGRVGKTVVDQFVRKIEGLRKETQTFWNERKIELLIPRPAPAQRATQLEPEHEEFEDEEPVDDGFALEIPQPLPPALQHVAGFPHEWFLQDFSQAVIFSRAFFDKYYRILEKNAGSHVVPDVLKDYYRRKDDIDAQISTVYQFGVKNLPHDSPFIPNAERVRAAARELYDKINIPNLFDAPPAPVRPAPAPAPAKVPAPAPVPAKRPDPAHTAWKISKVWGIALVLFAVAAVVTLRSFNIRGFWK